MQKRIKELIFTNFKHKPTKSQSVLIDILADFFSEKNNEKILLIKGYAGTGKTSLISAYINSLEIIKKRFVLLAPTGRAAKVLASYSKKQALTIHKKIYRQVSSNDGFGNFKLNFNLHKDTVFIVDEASMISN